MSSENLLNPWAAIAYPPTRAYSTSAVFNIWASFLTSSQVAGRVYSATFSLPGNHSVNSPTLSIPDHLFVVLVGENALRRARDVLRVSCHGRSGFRGGQCARRRGDTFADGSLNRLLIRLDEGTRHFRILIGHDPHHRVGVPGFEPARATFRAVAPVCQRFPHERRAAP